MNQAYNLFEQYAEWTDKTAQYPVTAENQYLALGIADECGELADAFFPDEVLKESGDILWYAARYAVKTLNVPFHSIIIRTDLYSASPSYKQVIHAVGIICGVEKKRVRDGDSWTAGTREEKNLNASSALTRVLTWVQIELRKSGFTLEQALYANQEKLNRRLEENTIKGDGDNR